MRVASVREKQVKPRHFLNLLNSVARDGLDEHLSKHLAHATVLDHFSGSISVCRLNSYKEAGSRGSLTSKDGSYEI